MYKATRKIVIHLNPLWKKWIEGEVFFGYSVMNSGYKLLKDSFFKLIKIFPSMFNIWFHIISLTPFIP